MRNRFLVSILNQGISSGANFLVLLWLVRAMNSESFGVWSIALAVMYLFAGYMNAMVLTQLAVRLPAISANEKTGYVGNMLLVLICICMLTLLVIAPLGLFVNIPGVSFYLIFSTLVMALFYTVKDFFVRLAYSNQRESQVLLINLTIAIVQFSGFVLLLWRNIELTPLSAILVTALAFFLAAIVGLAFSKNFITFDRFSKVNSDIHHFAGDGLWASGGVTVTWLQGQSYTYLSAIVLGPVAAAGANAARVFITPLQMILPAVNHVALPRLAALVGQSPNEARKFTVRLLMMLLAVASVYSVTLGILFDWLRDVLLEGKYQDIGTLVVCWVIAAIFQIVRDSASNLLQAMFRFDQITIANSISAFSAVIIGYFAISEIGRDAAVVGVMVGEILLSLLLWRKVINAR